MTDYTLTALNSIPLWDHQHLGEVEFIGGADPILAAVVPWAVMSFTFMCLAMWRDWKQSETGKAKLLFGVRLFSIVALTTALMILSESGVIA